MHFYLSVLRVILTTVKSFIIFGPQNIFGVFNKNDSPAEIYNIHMQFRYEISNKTFDFILETSKSLKTEGEWCGIKILKVSIIIILFVLIIL